jgi:hypothetical protein
LNGGKAGAEATAALMPIKLIAAIIGDVRIARILKNRHQRSEGLQMLQSRGSALSQSLQSLLARLDSGIVLRDQHTHDMFVSMGICTATGIYDPADALADLSHDPDGHQELSAFLRKETQRLVDEHIVKASAVIEATWAFLNAADLELPSTSQTQFGPR